MPSCLARAPDQYSSYLPTEQKSPPLGRAQVLDRLPRQGMPRRGSITRDNRRHTKIARLARQESAFGSTVDKKTMVIAACAVGRWGWGNVMWSTCTCGVSIAGWVLGIGKMTSGSVGTAGTTRLFHVFHVR